MHNLSHPHRTVKQAYKIKDRAIRERQALILKQARLDFLKATNFIKR